MTLAILLDYMLTTPLFTCQSFVGHYAIIDYLLIITLYFRFHCHYILRFRCHEAIFARCFSHWDDAYEGWCCLLLSLRSLGLFHYYYCWAIHYYLQLIGEGSEICSSMVYHTVQRQWHHQESNTDRQTLQRGNVASWYSHNVNECIHNQPRRYIIYSDRISSRMAGEGGVTAMLQNSVYTQQGNRNRYGLTNKCWTNQKWNT